MTNEVCSERRLQSHWIERPERPRWRCQCGGQNENKGASPAQVWLPCVMQKEGTSALEPHYQKLDWPEERKGAPSVAGGQLGAEQRGVRKAGRGPEAWETGSDLLSLGNGTAPIPCIFKRKDRMPRSCRRRGMEAQFRMLPQRHHTSEPVFVAEAGLAEAFPPS